MKLWFSLLMSFLIIANILAIYFLDEYIDRWFRFGVTFIFVLIYYFKYFSKYRLLFIFLLFALCDGFLVYYEIPEIKNSIYLVRILAYLLLILLVVPSLSKLHINTFTITVTVFILAIDIYLLNVMAESLPDLEKTTVFLLLFYSLGMASLVLAATSLSYLNRYSNKNSFLLVIVAFGCILSDIFFYNSHYLGFYEFYYLDRSINILAVGALVLFSKELVEKPKDLNDFDLKKF